MLKSYLNCLVVQANPFKEDEAMIAGRENGFKDVPVHTPSMTHSRNENLV